MPRDYLGGSEARRLKQRWDDQSGPRSYAGLRSQSLYRRSRGRASPPRLDGYSGRNLQILRC
jgi:hypothetical protein